VLCERACGCECECGYGRGCGCGCAVRGARCAECPSCANNQHTRLRAFVRKAERPWSFVRPSPRAESDDPRLVRGARLLLIMQATSRTRPFRGLPYPCQDFFPRCPSLPLLAVPSLRLRRINVIRSMSSCEGGCVSTEL
jgi:hypothetical protein